MRLPRLALASCRNGNATSEAMNEAPNSTSGSTSEEPRETAPISPPKASDTPTGSTPRSTSSAHHAAAAPGAAIHSDRKKRTSCRSAMLLRITGEAAGATSPDDGLVLQFDQLLDGYVTPHRVTGRHLAQRWLTDLADTDEHPRAPRMEHATRRRVGR